MSDTALRLGDNTSSQPFTDDVVVSNHTGQPLKFLSLRYGKYERFLVFDLDAGAVLKLRASPQFNREWPASSVFYRAYTNGGGLRGNAGNANRGGCQPPADGSRRYQVRPAAEVSLIAPHG